MITTLLFYYFIASCPSLLAFQKEKGNDFPYISRIVMRIPSGLSTLKVRRPL